MDDEAKAAILRSDPDPVALIDVLELIAPDALVTGWEHLPGGMGTAMHRIDVQMPSGATTSFILRRYLPEIGDTDAIALREALTLEALRASPLPAPEMLWADPDGTVFDRPAIAMTMLDGQPDLAAASDPAWIAGLAETLVAMQWVAPESVEHLPRLADLAALRDWVTAHGLPDSPYVDIDRVRAALDRGVDRVAAVPSTLVHGDFHPGNVLCVDHKVTGVVDWPRAFIGDARHDLMYCALDLVLYESREAGEELIAAYERLRGPVEDGWFFRLLAASEALQDPMDWAPGWRAHGVEVDDDAVRARFATWLDDALAAAEA